jgi:hypothetical protein
MRDLSLHLSVSLLFPLLGLVFIMVFRSQEVTPLKAGLVSVFQIFNLWTSRLLVVPLVRELSLVDHSVSFLAGVCLFEFVPARFL